MPMPRNSSHRQACLPLATVCGLHFLLGAVWEDPTQEQWLPGQLPPPHLQHMGDGARLKFVSALRRKPLWCCFFFGDVRSYSADCEFCMFCQIETRIRQPEHGNTRWPCKCLNPTFSTLSETQACYREYRTCLRVASMWKKKPCSPPLRFYSTALVHSVTD